MPFSQFRQREIQRKTCLRGFAGRDFILSAVFAAETLKTHETTGYEAGKWYIPIGSFLTKFVYEYEGIAAEPTKVKIYEKLGTNADAVQTLTLTGEEIGGSFTLGYGGQTTENISYAAKGSEVITALAKLSTIATSANIECTNSTKKLGEEALKIKFIGELANAPQPLLVVNYAGLTSKESKGKIVATTTTPGTSAEKIIGVYDGPEFDFWSNEKENQNLDEPIPIYFQGCVFDKSKLPEYTKYGLEAEEALRTCSFV